VTYQRFTFVVIWQLLYFDVIFIFFWPIMRVVSPKIAGGSEELILSEAPIPVPASGEILIKVRATALNRADILQRKGKYLPPPGASSVLGLEFAGEVATQVGPWKVGDRVMGIVSGGSYAEYLITYPDQIMAIPQHLTWLEAAAIPEAFLTAYQTLKLLGELSAGESVLIHAGGSGVGTAAIQLAKKFGAKDIIVTAGSAEKIERCIALGATKGINYKSEDFSIAVEAETRGRGVDVILDFIGADYWQKNMDSLGVDGRWVIIGSMGGVKVKDASLADILKKRVTLVGTTLRSRSLEYKRDLLKRFETDCGLALNYGELKPIIDRTFDLSEAGLAHERMESNKNFGKIILSVQ
jgi:putative PIG3 family NAD(P)H quinone oxidoreductase